MPEFLTPSEVDTWLKLPRGRAARLARRGLLPNVVLPDKSIRFDRDVLAEFLAQPRPRRVQAVPEVRQEGRP